MVTGVEQRSKPKRQKAKGLCPLPSLIAASIECGSARGGGDAYRMISHALTVTSSTSPQFGMLSSIRMSNWFWSPPLPSQMMSHE